MRGAAGEVTRTVSAVAVLFVAAALLVAPARSVTSTARLVNCGAISVLSQKWHVAAKRVRCTSARSLIRSLASKPRPSLHRYPGTYLGMKCFDETIAFGREIECRNARKQVQGLRHR